jgi:hypothetical protein
VLEGDVEASDVAREVGVVGDHLPDLHVELAAPPAPEQIEQAVVLAGDQQRHALRPRGVVEAPFHREALSDLRVEAAPQLVERSRQAAHVEDLTQEEGAALGVGRVLVGLVDVGALRVQEARHGGDDAGAVGAAHHQTRGVLGCHERGS